jgi:hypothetical protein
MSIDCESSRMLCLCAKASYYTTPPVMRLTLYPSHWYTKRIKILPYSRFGRSKRVDYVLKLVVVPSYFCFFEKTLICLGRSVWWECVWTFLCPFCGECNVGSILVD